MSKSATASTDNIEDRVLTAFWEVFPALSWTVGGLNWDFEQTSKAGSVDGSYNLDLRMPEGRRDRRVIETPIT